MYESLEEHGLVTTDTKTGGLQSYNAAANGEEIRGLQLSSSYIPDSTDCLVDSETSKLIPEILVKLRSCHEPLFGTP